MDHVNSMKARLARLEARLQSLVEGALRLFPFSVTLDEITPNLQAAMLGGKSRDDGKRIAPNPTP